MITSTVLNALSRPRALLLLIGLSTCTSSPMTLSLQPDFEVMTSAGVASVSIREAPFGMPDAEFTRLVSEGMAESGRASVIAGPVASPFPSRRIVWHVNSSGIARGNSKLVVNVFSNADPYAFEEETVTNSAPTVVIVSAIKSMSARLLDDVAANANIQNVSRRAKVVGGSILAQDKL